MKHHKKSSVYPTHSDWYNTTLLQSLTLTTTDSDSKSNPLLYSYTTSYKGFAASLNDEQVEELLKSEDVLKVYEDTVYQLHTTRTPEFLGLEKETKLWEGHTAQDLNQASHDVIIGVLDTGVWPESSSFDDAGMPEIPARWRGECETGPDFSTKMCNKKLIGARSFSRGDTIIVGTFAAVERGIFVSCSAGNSGPQKASLANMALWIMTVGAGTLDRDFLAYASLGNKKRFSGVSLYNGKGMGNEPVGLVYNKGLNQSSSICLPGLLEPGLVRGKVVVCDHGINAHMGKGKVVCDAGGVGMILANTTTSGEELVADSHLLPAVAWAAFSSRGPNMVTRQILKPDVIGPGVNILVGWSEAIGPFGLSDDTRKTQFNIMSGTSMSCPHISGLAALLKAAHPGWSPSAIKSALMTTAYVHDNTKFPLRDAAGGAFSNPWAHGACHMNPHKALSPGLVYDAIAWDYVKFLCSLEYTPEHIQLITKRHGVNCTKKFSDPGQLNYPSFSILFGGKRVVRYTRVLINVGETGSIYNVTVDAPSTMTIKVKPTRLVFEKVGERQRYTVTFVSKRGVGDSARYGFGSIMWSNAQHQVRSPVAFSWTLL
ncbi:Subtilisin-like protease [Glycine soja]|uniref:Subtilisin-like protease n=1 Tax=Glycine soja TaxID=3848 RepID=A0A0B2PA35_GLYSO|nr:Subtilisin-like protease [Glycine soja]